MREPPPTGDPLRPRPPFTRRRFLTALAAGALGLTACSLFSSPVAAVPFRLRSRPRPPTRRANAGLQPLGLGGSRDGLLYVPGALVGGSAAPLLVLLHGAGGDGDAWFGSYAARADEAGCVILAPDSRRGTWDLFFETGSDVEFMDQALAHVFDRVAIDGARIALGGFSDGASYALSLGLANGDLYSQIVGYSPGFLSPPALHGKPAIFISHGTNDAILPIDLTSGVFVPDLREHGYDVTYLEFEGGHAVPPEISTAAFDWLRARWT